MVYFYVINKLPPKLEDIMDQERLNALETALNNEMKEHEFYMKNAERTANPLGKSMFRQIANEELEHHERLKQLHQKWTANEKWPETVPLTVKETNIKDTLADVLNNMDSTAKGDDDDLAAVRVAIEFEAKGMAYYEKLRDQSDEPKVKDFFDLLAQIEREHYLSLKEAEEFFVDPAAYYTRMEHPGLDGA
jgi:rubrerythrin